MHEFNELVRLAAPIASLGGVAATIRIVKARGAKQARMASKEVLDSKTAIAGERERMPPVEPGGDSG